MCTNESGTNSVKPPVSLLDSAEHDRDVRTETDAVGDAVALEPLLRVDLVGAEHSAHRVVEDFRSGTRQRPQARVHESP
jgi:hypothetical protein